MLSRKGKGYMMKFCEISPEALSWNPFTQIGKGWFLVGAGNETSHNAMTVSWGGLGVLWGKNVVTVYIRQNRHTKTFIDSAEYFTVSALPEMYRKEMGYFGSHSGRDGDKFTATGLTPHSVDGTIGVAEADVILVCKKILKADLSEDTFIDSSARERWYAGVDTGNIHTMYVGEIVKVLKRE